MDKKQATTVRIDKDLHEKIRKESFKTKKSMNEIIVELIERKYEEEKQNEN